MRAKCWIPVLACLVLGYACAPKQLPYTHADAPYLGRELPSVRDVCLFPFGYYTNLQGLSERLGEATAEMVMAEVRRSLTERSLHVRDQDLVNRVLLAKGVVRETSEELTLLPTAVRYDLAYVGYSETMKKLLRDYVEGAAHAPEGVTNPLAVRTEALSPEVVVELGNELAADLVVRGRIANLGKPVVESVDYEYSLVPRFIGNRDGVMVRAAYEEGLGQVLPVDLELVEQRVPPQGKVAGYWALQIRLFAQETGEGRVVWSNTVVMTYPVFSDSGVDQLAKAERLRKTIAKEVKLLIGDLFR